jgi:enoyl-[acyl-carrier protein] reductase I
VADAVARAPVSELVDIMDAGLAFAHLATPYPRRLTWQTVCIDGSVSIMV